MCFSRFTTTFNPSSHSISPPFTHVCFIMFLGGSDGEESACNAGDPGSTPRWGKIPWSRAWQPTPVFLPGELHGQRSLAGYSLWSRKELDLTEQLSLSVVCLSHHSPLRSLLPFLHSRMCMLSSFSCVRLFASLWTVACQAPLSMGYSRQEHWSGLLCPPPGDPHSGIKPASPASPALAGSFFTTRAT